MISETDSYNVRGHPHADFVRYPTNAVPRTVYKYVSNIKAVENIIQGKIKFASFYELNDASEAATVGDEKAIEQALGELQIKGFSDTQFEK
ncbi:MAG: hypothetical protein ORN98_08990, partial [Alphaproteobacteria bacterium]|nr:hypothetical protein [Alphaproteobacteria bacterium]